MNRTITLEKEPLTRVGRSLEIGTPAPPFTAVSSHMKDVSLATYAEKTKLVFFFPSIDHPVCDLQVREMNRRAKDLPEAVAVIGISRDTPFALKRFRETFDIKNLELISDQRYSSFGIGYGVLIRELNLLCRGAVILDRSNHLQYRQIVSELSNQPDFDDIMEHLREVIRAPADGAVTPLDSGHESGQGGESALSSGEISTLMSGMPGWELVEGKGISKRYSFKSFTEAKLFLDLICTIAEEQNHHPTLTLSYNRLHVSLTTHTAGEPTEKDFNMARLIDSLNGG